VASLALGTGDRTVRFWHRPRGVAEEVAGDTASTNFFT
jgi:hypothetical protein